MRDLGLTLLKIAWIKGATEHVGLMGVADASLKEIDLND